MYLCFSEMVSQLFFIHNSLWKQYNLNNFLFAYITFKLYKEKALVRTLQSTTYPQIEKNYGYFISSDILFPGLEQGIRTINLKQLPLKQQTYRFEFESQSHCSSLKYSLSSLSEESHGALVQSSALMTSCKYCPNGEAEWVRICYYT